MLRWRGNMTSPGGVGSSDGSRRAVAAQPGSGCEKGCRDDRRRMDDDGRRSLVAEEAKISDDNADIQAGINIVLRALEAPIRQIAENSGVEGSIVVGKGVENKSQTFGFDAQTEQYVDMLNAGIVDPAKVVRVALQDAAAIAGLMITTEAMIADRPKADTPAMPGGGGGMGGMGGMDY